jgi:hypothetical protein
MMMEWLYMVFRQLRLLTLGVLVLSLVLGIAAGWIVAKGTSASSVAEYVPVRITATQTPTSTSSDVANTDTPANRTPSATSVAATSPTAAVRPTPTKEPGGLAVTPTAEQGTLCVVNVEELKVRQEPGATDDITVIGGLPLRTEVRILEGPREVAGSQYTWVRIESDGIIPATIQSGWVAYELLRCA